MVKKLFAAVAVGLSGALVVKQNVKAKREIVKILKGGV